MRGHRETPGGHELGQAVMCVSVGPGVNPSDQESVFNGDIDLSSKLSSGWPEARVCVFKRLPGAVSLTVNIQAQLPQVRVEFTECVFDGLYHVRNMIFLGRSSPIIRRGETALSLYATKVAAACNPHVFRLYQRQRERLFGNQHR